MEATLARRYLQAMLMEFMRVLLGLAIALCHVPLADFLRKQDCELADALRARGIAFPGGLPQEASRILFFVFGIAIALFTLARICLTLR
jgi:hypothetical protein